MLNPAHPVPVAAQEPVLLVELEPKQRSGTLHGKSGREGLYVPNDDQAI
jgi:hypothetical protein